MTISREVAALIGAVLRDVAELPDRNSPDDWPDALIVTGEELEIILEEAFEQAATALTQLQARVTELEAENARLREDAHRYRWLRDHSVPPHNFYISVPDEFSGVKYSPNDVDAYIDAARQALNGDTSHDQ